MPHRLRRSRSEADAAHCVAPPRVWSADACALRLPMAFEVRLPRSEE